jgi:tetratricopeptide (TPR) repeat protein
MPLRLSILLVLLAASSAPASPQGSDFSAFRDSLTALRDATELRRLEVARRPTKNATPWDYVAHGLVALRLYDLTGDALVNKTARLDFEAALKQSPGLGWAQFGLGITLASSPEAKPVNEGGKPGFFVTDDVVLRVLKQDPRSRARRAFSAALQAEPPVPAAARQLADLAVIAQDGAALKEARGALQKLAGADQAQPSDYEALSRVESAMGQSEAAIVAADRAVEAGATSSALYTAAQARLIAGQKEAGQKLYHDAIQSASDEDLERYFDDVKSLASEVEKGRWSSADAAARRKLLDGFFDIRAALGGVRTPDRLAEHFQRLAYVKQHFQRRSLMGAPPENAFLWLLAKDRSSYDDRGVIYLRHGAPTEQIRTLTDMGQPNNESWYYRRPDGTARMFHFFQMRGDYVLPYRLPCATQDFFRDRATRDARLGMEGLRCSPFSSLSMESYSADMREVFHEALTTDTHFPRFLKDLPFFYDLYTFRGPEKSTAIVAAFAVPANALEITSEQSGVRYRFDVSLILADTAKGSVSRTDDSASIAMPRPLSSNDLLRTHLEVNMPPSSSTLQRVIVSDPTEPGIGQLYGGPFPIPDYTGKQLMLSDIALGQPTKERGWKRGDVSLLLVPTSQFPEESFSLYYEVYNLPAGTKYSTEIEIERLDKSAGAKLRSLFGGSGDVRFRFGGESTAGPDGTLPELRRIEAPLGRGRYRLTVVVKDLGTGATTRASRNFIIPR